ncbi:52 kDa repressor of the inhibitor of the protein kinase-like [Palaemon carinicauda]|uniref:52 kDa repressor of the inhibitor of the protein kinase-like n=1 Tax=Palaemon carinicauda TaxID=392227 RepID=UPI0035B61455
MVRTGFLLHELDKLPGYHGNDGYYKYCVLFQPKNTQLNNAVLVHRPFTNLQKAKGKEGVLDQHEKHVYHKYAVCDYKTAKESSVNPEHHVDAMLSNEWKELYKKNLEILKSVIDAIVFCGKQNITLRGRRDDRSSSNSNTGNFLSILNLLATHDPVLKCHHESGKRENQINISESFIDFVNLDRTTGEAIADAILKSLTDNGYTYQNLRGQGYDGASAMSSSRTGINGRIMQVAPYAIYSHCQSHLLNLSIASSCKLPAVQNMIGSLNGVFLFFSNSPKCQSLFEKVLDQSDDYKGNEKKLLSLCKTRWVERHDCFNTFHELYIPTVTTLEVIFSPHEFTDIIGNEDWSWDSDTRTKARGLFSTMKSFEFVTAFYATKQTLYAIRPIAVKLQRSDLDCYEAYNMVDSTISEIKDLRDSLDTKFSQWFAESSKLTEAVGGSVARPHTAQRQIHRSNAPAQTTEEYFRINLAAPLVDHLLSEMDTRFNHESRTAATLFEVIPKLILENHDLKNLAEKLLYWENDLPSPLSLTDELNHWKKSFFYSGPVADKSYRMYKAVQSRHLPQHL